MKMMIKTKRNNSLAILMCCGLLANAQNIGSLYLKMPDVAEPLFSTSARMEMLEYFKAGQPDSTRNRLGGFSSVLAYDSINNYLRIQTGQNSDEQIRLFNPGNHAAFIGVIHTIRTPFVCSDLCFYDTLWNKLPVDFVVPDGTAWIDEDKLSQSNLDQSWVRKMLKNSFVELRFDVSDNVIVVKNQNMAYLSEADAKEIAPLIWQKDLIYKWQDGAWIQQP